MIGHVIIPFLAIFAQAAAEPQIVGARTGKVLDIAFSRDGDFLAAWRTAEYSTENTDRVELFEITDGKLGEPRCLTAGQFRFSHDSKSIAIAERSRLTLWDVRKLKPQLTIDSPNQIRELEFVGSDRVITSTGPGDHEPVLRIWNTSTGAPAGLVKCDAAVEEFEVSPNGEWIVTLEGHAIQVREVPSGKILHTLDDSSHIDRMLRIDPAGKFVAWVRDSSWIEIRDPQTGRRVGTTARHALGSQMSAPGGALAFSADSTRIFTGTGGNDSQILIWGLPEGKPLGRLGSHGGAVLSIACHPTKPLIASGSGIENYVISMPPDVESVKLWNISAEIRP